MASPLPPALALFSSTPGTERARRRADFPLSLSTVPATFPRVSPPAHAPDPTADAALVARSAAGDEQAFGQLYRNFAPGLFSMVHTIVGDAEAEDVVQEAFVQMWKRAATYDPVRSSAFTWAVMIARHKAIDRLRARQRRDRGTETLTTEFNLVPLASEASSGSIAAAFADDRERVLSALTQLPDEQQSAIRLAFFGGLTHTAISEQLNTPLGTIKARIRRGLLALQALLQQR